MITYVLDLVFNTSQIWSNFVFLLSYSKWISLETVLLQILINISLSQRFKWKKVFWYFIKNSNAIVNLWYCIFICKHPDILLILKFDWLRNNFWRRMEIKAWCRNINEKCVFKRSFWQVQCFNMWNMYNYAVIL